MYMQNNISSSISQFYDANEGFIKGNLNKNIYEQYKNYKPKELVFTNEKDALLLFIQKCDLAIQDLTLYLDIKENDENANKMLNFYKCEYDKAKKKYLDKFGPLEKCQETKGFKWNDCPFPWDK